MTLHGCKRPFIGQSTVTGQTLNWENSGPERSVASPDPSARAWAVTVTSPRPPGSKSGAGGWRCHRERLLRELSPEGQPEGPCPLGHECSSSQAFHLESGFFSTVVPAQSFPGPCLFSCRASVTDNPWVRLAAAMLARCTSQSREALGEEVLKMCRSLYNTRQMLPAQVSGSPAGACLFPHSAAGSVRCCSGGT